MANEQTTIIYFSGKGPPYLENHMELHPHLFKPAGILVSYEHFKRTLTLKRMHKIIGYDDGKEK